MKAAPDRPYFVDAWLSRHGVEVFGGQDKKSLQGCECSACVPV
jgi:hypothetical protein